MENIHFQNPDIIKTAFKLYSEKNFDIVDCLLYGYKVIDSYDVKTFDVKLEKIIEK